MKSDSYEVEILLTFLVVMILFSVLIVISGKDYEYKEDVVDIEFVVKNVNLVQYSNRDGLTSFVYLEAPNGKKVTVKNLEFYELMKHHIGQRVVLQVNREYNENARNGKRVGIKEYLSNNPDSLKTFLRGNTNCPVIVRMEGDEQPYEDRIQNVEVQTRTSTVVIPMVR